MESHIIVVWDNSQSKENEKFLLWHIQWMCISCKYVHVMYSHNPITHKTESQFGIKLIRQKHDKLDILRIYLFTMVYPAYQYECSSVNIQFNQRDIHPLLV